MSVPRKHSVRNVGIGYGIAATTLVLALWALGRALGLPAWPTRVAAGLAFVMMPFVVVIAWALADTGPEHAAVARRR